MKSFTTLLSVFFILGQTAVAVQASPVALIYKGAGSCSADQDDAGASGYGCSQAAAVVAQRAGFQVKFVGPEALDEDSSDDEVQALFQGAKVWIQPGGIAVTAYEAMTAKLRRSIVKFIRQGGGYVGWCAGAFMATSEIGTSGTPGFGIFPGKTDGFEAYGETADVDFSFEKIRWKGRNRKIYFEGGPSMSGFKLTPGAQAIGYFDSGEVAAARAPYGKGRVYISGPHPEAPTIWSKEDHIRDPDGSDRDLAVDMVRWAAALSPQATRHAAHPSSHHSATGHSAHRAH